MNKNVRNLIIGVIIAIFSFLIIRGVSKQSAQNAYNTYLQNEKLNRNDNNDVIHQLEIQTSSLPELNDNWERIVIENIGSFDIPSTMELQDGSYKALKNALINTLQMNQPTFQVIVQQKGLNTLSNEGYSRYARIMFKTEPGEKDSELILYMDISQFSKDDISGLNNLYKGASQLEFSNSGMKLLEWYPLRIEKINGMSCIHTSYKRQMGTNQPVIVHNYNFFNYDYNHTFIMSYRENEKDYWEDDFKTVLNSLRIEKRR